MISNPFSTLNIENFIIDKLDCDPEKILSIEPFSFTEMLRYISISEVFKFVVLYRPTSLMSQKENYYRKVEIQKSDEDIKLLYIRLEVYEEFLADFEIIDSYDL